VKNTFDLDGCDSSSLQRGQQYTAQRIAKRQAKAALKRFRLNGCGSNRIRTGLDVQLVRFNQCLPIFLDHVRALIYSRLTHSHSVWAISALYSVSAISNFVRLSGVSGADNHYAAPVSRP